ncbi:MAG: YibE/F family protein [Meiothermus sp.]|nr:YibE/F family protein [Meiothermus sp.]
MRLWLLLFVVFTLAWGQAQAPQDPGPSTQNQGQSQESFDPNAPNTEPGSYTVGRLVSIGEKTAIVEMNGERLEAELPSDVESDFRSGQRVVVYAVDGRLFVTEPYRINYLWGLLGLFVLVTVVLGRGKGLRGLIGTAASIGMVGWFIVPQISAGNNPLLITFVGAFAILALSIYFVHGVNRKTSAALLGTTIAALVALVGSVEFTGWMQFTGLTSEEVFLARYQLGGNLDLVALYLAGVVVGALGALNDVTVTQASVVQALVQANPRYTIRELYQRGMTVGFDHIGSLVNTLILAYAAGTLPLLLLIHKSDVPLWQLLNNETFAAEIVAMLIGSLALVLAVPLTTLIAAWLLRGRKLDYLESRWPSQVAQDKRSVSALLGEEGQEDGTPRR